jgi:hypothetical protein
VGVLNLGRGCRLRRRLYTRLGASNARQILAANYPGGSARDEIKRRVDMYANTGEGKKAMSSYVIDEISEELVKAYMEFSMSRVTSGAGASFEGDEVRSTLGDETRVNKTEATI